MEDFPYNPKDWRTQWQLWNYGVSGEWCVMTAWFLWLPCMWSWWKPRQKTCWRADVWTWSDLERSVRWWWQNLGWGFRQKCALSSIYVWRLKVMKQEKLKNISDKTRIVFNEVQPSVTKSTDYSQDVVVVVAAVTCGSIQISGCHSL